jgi:prepilin peptidase CpaA
MNQALVYSAIATVFALAAACIDVKTRKIPNLLTLAAFVLGLSLHFALGGRGDGFKTLLAALIAGVIFLVFHIAGGMGAGDVKLIAGLAACYGLTNMPYLLIFTSLAGGVMALAMAMKHSKLRQTFSNMGTLAAHHGRSGLVPHDDLNLGNRSTLRLPYAVAIAAGCVLTNFISLGRA